MLIKNYKFVDNEYLIRKALLCSSIDKKIIEEQAIRKILYKNIIIKINDEIFDKTINDL